MYVDPSGHWFWAVVALIAKIASIVSISAAVVGGINYAAGNLNAAGIFFQISQISGYVAAAAGITSFIGSIMRTAGKQVSINPRAFISGFDEGAADTLEPIVVKASLRESVGAAWQVTKGAMIAGAAGTASAGASSALLSGINWGTEKEYKSLSNWASSWGEGTAFVPSYRNTNLFTGVGHVMLSMVGMATETNSLSYVYGNYDKIIGYSGGAQTVASAGMMGQATANEAHLVAPQLLISDPNYMVESGAYKHVYKYQSPADPLSMINIEMGGSSSEGMFVGLSVRFGGGNGVSYRTYPDVKHGEWKERVP